jgi:hypothetical protein
MIGTIIKKYGKYSLVFTGDASGNNRSASSSATIWQIVKTQTSGLSRKFEVRSKNISLEDSRTLCNSVLNNIDVLINDSCKQLLRDMSLSMVDKNGKLIKDNNSNGNHFLDCIRYIFDANFFDMMTNPKRYL